MSLLRSIVLSFVKGFHLKSERVVADGFSCAAIESAKKDLWNFFSYNLMAANLSFQAIHDSVKRSQLTANIEDLA